MNLSKYVNKRVKIELTNNYFYEGLVTDADSNSITLIHRTGKPVTIKENAIFSIVEI